MNCVVCAVVDALLRIVSQSSPGAACSTALPSSSNSPRLWTALAPGTNTATTAITASNGTQAAGRQCRLVLIIPRSPFGPAARRPQCLPRPDLLVSYNGLAYRFFPKAVNICDFRRGGAIRVAGSGGRGAMSRTDFPLRPGGDTAQLGV